MNNPYRANAISIAAWAIILAAFILATMSAVGLIRNDSISRLGRPIGCSEYVGPVEGLSFVGGSPGRWVRSGHVYGYSAEEDSTIWSSPECTR